MCGRYVSREQAAIEREYNIRVRNPFERVYNAAPSMLLPVVRAGEAPPMRWGLIPFWSKNAKIGYSTINAKAETVATAPAFREAFKSRRCLIPADAFYEWQKIDAKTKQPFAIGMKDGSPYAFAGLWERWREPATKEPLETFTVITTDANELLEAMHDRMPVILAPADYARWLSEESDPRDLMRPFSADLMRMWPISTRVNKPENDDASIIEPIEPATDAVG